MGPKASMTGVPYVLRDCVSRSAINTCKRPADTQEYFPTTSSSLVADDRSEVGIAYKDSVFPPIGNVNVTIDGSTTDATHTITLTADPGNRHYGIAGAGVILDGGAATDSAVLILDDFVTVEWLEIRGGGSGFDGVEWQSIGAVNKGVARYLLVATSGQDAWRIDTATGEAWMISAVLAPPRVAARHQAEMAAVRIDQRQHEDVEAVDHSLDCGRLEGLRAEGQAGVVGVGVA
jgi:hypothetical protein